MRFATLSIYCGVVWSLFISNYLFASILCGSGEESTQVVLACPPAHKINLIMFASYGTPTGSCGSYALSSCNAANSLSFVSGLCLGKFNCTISAGNANFGDPCTGSLKHFNAQVNCASTVPTSQPSRQPTSQPSRQPSAQPSHPSSQPTTQPTSPTSQPSKQPSVQPSARPSSQPSLQPTSQPSAQPSSHPSAQPSRHPSSQPSGQPTMKPSAQPSVQPTSQPTCLPTAQPSCQPSSQPTSHPSSQPSTQPTIHPTIQPSSKPSTQPSCNPTKQPTSQPTRRPSVQPSRQPTSQPSSHPTSQPTIHPTVQPSGHPSEQPTSQPTRQPSSQPSMVPSRRPTSQPTSQPSNQPSGQPTDQPSRLPSNQPTESPTTQPSSFPSSQPTNSPTTIPSDQPTSVPISFPSSQPSNQPTVLPSSLPTSQPSSLPSVQPTIIPTGKPTVQPTHTPSKQPTAVPSIQPSSYPTAQPSDIPTNQPTSQPSSNPTVQPSCFPSTQPSSNPSNQPTSAPTVQPSTIPSSQPSSFPSNQPTNRPTRQPSGNPTIQPTCFPTAQPSNKPSSQPSLFPSSQPTNSPSGQPSVQPSKQPTSFPTQQPSGRPSSQPSTQPTCQPSDQPSSSPSNQPTVIPSDQPTRLPTNQPTSTPTSLPSNQPTSSPSLQPFSSPTSLPSSQPTLIPTAQPFAFPTSAPVATIHQTNGVLFWLGATSGSNNTQNGGNHGTLGTSYLLFGRNFNHQSRFPFRVSLDDSSSREFVAEINPNEGGIQHDITTRSTTIIGDVNGDGFNDLLVGYPLASKCSVYLGNGIDDFSILIANSGESFAIVGDPYDDGGFLGWSSIRIGDLNGDGLDEIVVSAIFANTVYVVYGKRDFPQNLKVSEIQQTDGFKIIGHPDEINFGVSLTLLHDFRKGSRADLAITAQTASGGQNVIYILFGAVVFGSNADLKIEEIIHNPKACFKLIAPPFSYAGFSIAGIGDINSDGYDDLAIGSVPYSRGSFSIQTTYIIYGRSITANGINELQLSMMGPEDGFIITGGGFLVTGVGDVNSDSINDMMITSYYGWNGQSCAYVITSPPNMTYSPSLQPSSQPTARITTVSPSTHMNRTQTVNSSGITQNSSMPTLRPSIIPSVLPNSDPTIEPTRLLIAVGTSHPTQGKPSLSPTITPTSGYHRLRGFPPTNPPSLMPTINTTNYIELDCSGPGDYQGMNETSYKFTISANQGTVNILGNDDGEATNLYVLFCPIHQVTVVIKNFRLSTDIISVTHLSAAGFPYFSVKDIPYSSKSGPLTLLFCENNKLQVQLSTHSVFNLQESNFLFPQATTTKQNTNKKESQVQIGIAIAIVGLFCFILYISRTNKNPEDSPSYFHDKQPKDEDNSMSSNSSLSGLLREWQDFPSEDFSDFESDSLLSTSFTLSTMDASARYDEEEGSESLGSIFLALLNYFSDQEEELLDDDSLDSLDFDLSEEEISAMIDDEWFGGDSIDSLEFDLLDEEISLDIFDMEATEESVNK
jgi:hypothetical protein